MGTESVLRTLVLYNEKADKLEGLSFTKKIFSEESGFTMTFQEGGSLEAQRIGPDAEAIDAFVLTLRFFIQDNEKSSLRNMKSLYDNLTVNPGLIRMFNEARDTLNIHLGKPTFITFNGKQLTNRDVYEVFTWGGLAHAHEAKKQIFDQWRQIPFFFPMIENVYVSSLALMINVILRIREVNKQVIGELTGAAVTRQ